MTESTELNKTDGTTRSIRNFRNATDVEGFYRFLYDNELRREAKMALDLIVSKTKKPKKRRKKIQ